MQDAIKGEVDMKQLEDLPNNSFLKYRYTAVWLTGLFLIVAMAASSLSWTSLNTDIDFISENRFVANILFLGFVIAVVERLLEVITATFRRRTRLEIQRQIDESVDEGERKAWSETLIAYKAETRRLTLLVSLSIGCILASLGLVSVFGALTNDDLLAGKVHIAVIDAVDVVVTGWIIAGGSEGFNKITSALEKIMSPTRTAAQG